MLDDEICFTDVQVFHLASKVLTLLRAGCFQSLFSASVVLESVAWTSCIQSSILSSQVAWYGM